MQPLSAPSPSAPEDAVAPEPGGDGAPPALIPERPLPDLYYTLIERVPPRLEGIERVQYLAEQLEGTVPPRERDAVRRLYERLARKMVELDASDLDLGGPAARGQVWYRVYGRKQPYEAFGTLSQDEATLLILSQLTRPQQERLLDRFAVDFGYTLPAEGDDPPRRYRTTAYFDNGALGLSKRMLAWKPRSLRSLGFHPLIEHGFMFERVRDGVTLVTGVTGSGKSTTLDAIIDANNDDFDGHILVVAQPLEYIHESKRCIVRNREVGTDVASFVDGMVQGLRQDPDIVVVGEMRDAETITAALEMADTGHKVFSTLHTGSAVESIDRIIAEYPPVEQERIRHRLADVLRCVVSQKLLPSVGGGRVLAKEVLWVTSSARAAIKNGNTGEIYQMIWQGADQGMVTLEQDLARLVQIGDVSLETALDYANNKRRLLSLLR
ncbi:MAG: type IV pilus twitching motility protein PilT [Rubricoccaceae bacterium]|nr:type IV pilus twitching motility protein PilT [Rubricoccaceae bacterium]